MQRESQKLQKSGMQQCQKCLRFGHWTYECKNETAYLYRPSRTTIIKNPDLQPEYKFEAGPKGPKVHDGDKKRGKFVKSESESSSGESRDAASEEEKLHKELLKLIQKNKELDKKGAKQKSSSSSSSSGSSASYSSSGSSDSDDVSSVSSESSEESKRRNRKHRKSPLP